LRTTSRKTKGEGEGGDGGKGTLLLSCGGKEEEETMSLDGLRRSKREEGSLVGVRRTCSGEEVGTSSKVEMGGRVKDRLKVGGVEEEMELGAKRGGGVKAGDGERWTTVQEEDKDEDPGVEEAKRVGVGPRESGG
jgi:hypothetical protein